MNIGADTPSSSPHLQRGEYLRPLTEEESKPLKSKFQDFLVAELLHWVKIFVVLQKPEKGSKRLTLRSR